MEDATLFLYLQKELNINERKKVEEWIKMNPEHFQKVQLIWEKSQTDASKIKPNINKMWDAVNASIESSNKRNILNKSIFIRRLKYAAIFTLIIGLTGVFVNHKMKQIEWIEYSSYAGKTNDFELPDGSIISLNQGSHIHYKKQFLSKNREVKFTGEAFFKVKKNPNRPFIIHVNNTVVKVLGTSFNINATDTTANILVSVKTGKVMFYEKGAANNAIFLTAGDQGIYSFSDQIFMESELENENYLAWKTGVLMFRNNTIKEVCKVLCKHYDKEIIIEGSDLKERRITARYENKSLENILELLKISLDINYLEKEGAVYLTK